MEKIITKGFLLLIFLGCLSSCNNWLEVSPKSQIKEEKHFSREGGFKDQLTGVYTRMSTKAMYGLQMGIGFTEVLSQNYNVDANSTTWRYATEYDYTNSTCEGIIHRIWNETYSCIANLNILLRNIDKVNPNIWSDTTNYYLYKGEALGLRAFLHLELMRLFACSPKMNRNAKGVPYVTEYSTDIVSQKTVDETMNLIIKDLLEAKACLEHDILKTSETPYTQRTLRIGYFNYYAVVATLARAYLWNEDKQDALPQAREIIAMADTSYYSKPFNWADYQNQHAGDKSTIDRTFTTEHIFYLEMNGWEDISDGYLKATAGLNVLTPSENKANDIYEVSKSLGNDYRLYNGYEHDGEKRYCTKFWYSTGSKYNGLYPIIRMTESYYIAAECLRDSDPVEAIRLLNRVRENRGISLYPLDEHLTADEIQEEIYKEYRKEFVGEGGQLFYYYKRLNASAIEGTTVNPDKSVYVLPIPSSDVEFGGYEN